MARPPPNTGGPPISFKTVPGRHRTQKWNVARQYDYSGDDWGGYDPYDDYGEQPPPPGMQQGGPYSAGPMPQSSYGGLPSQQPGPGQRARQQSFDDGDEKRAFTGPAAPGWDVNRSGSPARSAVSSGSGGRPSGDSARPGTGQGRMRDFTNPEQVPPPLNTRGSPAPMHSMPATAPLGGPYAPRKQSLSRGSPAPDVIPTPANTAPTTAVEKELPTPPFIRPSDIYKRMAEEKEKERKNSLDSDLRPSLDTSDATRDSSRQRPLSSVDEGVADGEEEEAALSANVSGPMDMPHDFGEPSESRKEVDNTGHALPPIQGVSGFGSSMFGSSATTDSEQTPTAPRQTQQSASSSLQATPIATRPPPGSDPAAEILAERTHETPITDIGRRPDGLSHQVSQASSHGFTSAVNRAFDQSDLSRDSSQSTKQSGDVSRSNTTSTSGISPIMSKAPWNEQMVPAVPTIAEEYQGRASSESSRNAIPRKPSPQQSANPSPRPSVEANRDVGGAGVEKGYRRSLDPPSSDNSPARTPGLETAEGPGRRLSAGMTAQTVSAAEADAKAEPNQAEKEELEQRMGRPRAGTDYSIRESDLARAVNSSPDKGEFDPEAAKAEKNEQDLFVETHPQTSAPGTGVEGPASGRSSPAKGRVREIADKYQDLHSHSRRGSTASSKSSWSNFRGSDENLPGKLAKRHNTNASNMVSESDYGGVEEGGIRDSPVDATPIAEPPPIDGRPGLPSQQSFRPQLPGGWVSYSTNPGSGAGTPGANSSLAPTSAGPAPDDRASWYPGDDGPVDLTPTTRKFPLEGSHQSPSNSMLGQAKDAGTALGAALISSVGLGHQTRDFGSSEPAQEVEVPNTDRKLAGETRGLNVPERPQFNRGDTEASAITTVSNPSVVSDNSRPPTPPAKDTPQPPIGSHDRENNFFSAAIAPLRTGRSTAASPEIQQAAPEFANYGSGNNRGLQRDDTIRREIVRDLDGRQQDAELTQDALDAPENAARVAQGGNALPAAEISDDSPNKPHPLRMLDQRFSWEQQSDDRGLLDTPRKEEDAPMIVQSEGGKEIGGIGGVPRVKEPEPESSPEIRPEMPYERPRSRGLHIMNASDDEDSDEEKNTRPSAPDVGMTAVAGAGAGGGAIAAGYLGAGGPVSPLTKSQENLHLRAQQAEKVPVEDERRSSLRDIAPSPISQGSGSMRLPSYYIQDSSTLGMDDTLSPPLQQEGNRYFDADAAAAAPEVVAPRAGPTFVDASVPAPPEKEPSIAATSPTSPTSKQKIPPFREILAIKNTDARIKGYDDTRRTFADMDTGLSNWLSGMLAQNPEYANLSTESYSRPALQSTTSGLKGHKTSPSISKFTKQFGSGSDPQRSASVNAGGSSDSKTPGGSVDMDKLQQRGKDLMKGAGVLGGKAQAGAKGLLAKGKSRFGTQRESKSKMVSPTTTIHMVPPAAPFNSNEPTSPPSKPETVRSPSHFSRVTDAEPISPPTDSTCRSQPPASNASPSADSALAVPISNTVAINNSLPPILPPINPPDRSQSQTPGSTSSTSGILSRTLSRLRERSRSISSSRRSKSRPQSLVLLSSNHGSELKTVEDASPRAPKDGFTAGAERGSEFGMAAISPWSEPDEVGAMGGAVPLPERLGVLPSPAADGFSIIHESPVKGVKQGGDGVPESPTKDRGLRQDIVDEREDVADEHLDTADKRLDERAPVDAEYEPATTPPMTEDRSTTLSQEEQTTNTASDDERDELYDTTPKKLSPVSIVQVDATEHAEEATPTAAKPRESEDLQSDVPTLSSTDVEQAIAGSVVMHQEHAPDEMDVPAPPPSEIKDISVEAAVSSPEPDVTDDNAPISRQSTDLLAVPTIAEPTDAQEWDKRSAVSSNNDFHDAKQETIDNDQQSSRRSSVSSLGQDESLEGEEPIMSSHAVPAGPSPEQSTLKPDNRLMNRPYQFGDAQDGRSKSYISLGRDSTGAPLQETLDVADKPKHDSVDLSNFDGPPASAQPFQRHPAVRDVSGESKPKRFSGMVKGRKPTLPSDTSPPTRLPAAPAASAISDHFGLEGLQDDADNVVVGEVPPYRIPDKQEEKKAKRKSGLFDAFKRSPSVSKPEISRESSSQRLDSQRSSVANLPAQENSRPMSVEPTRSMVTAPQRASTTAKEPEQKKKRFSGLGSIFGRSSTTGHKPEKPRKLMKQVPDQTSQRQSTAPPLNHETTEAMRQQRMIEQQERQPKTYPPPLMGPSSHQHSLTDSNLFKSPEDTAVPPGGWYGRTNQEAEARVFRQGNPPTYRPLHSGIQQRNQPLRQVPETFSPAQPSYNGRMRPLGPQTEQGVYSPPTSPGAGGTSGQYPPYLAQDGFDQRPAHGMRHDSNESEVSGQSEWQRSEWRRQSSSPSISPVQTRRDSDAFPPGRNMRVGSISEEMARSPAKEYNDQQTPWAISMPRAGEYGPRRMSHGRPFGMQGGYGPPPPPPLPPPGDYAPSGIGYAEEYPPPNRYQQQRGIPMSPESPSTSMPTQQFDPVMAHAPVFDERPPRGISGHPRNAYPSPPTSPESQWFYNRSGLVPPSQTQYNSRYDEAEATREPRKTSYVRQRMYSYDDEGEPPPAAQQGRMSGHTEQTEDARGDESVEMRGVSYPGQEWTPERWD